MTFKKASIDLDSARTAGRYLAAFANSRLDDLREAALNAKDFARHAGYRMVDEQVYHFAMNLFSWLSQDFTNNSIPEVHASPSAFATDVGYLRQWCKDVFDRLQDPSFANNHHTPVIANYAAQVMDAAEETLRQCGIDDPTSAPVLLDILDATVPRLSQVIPALSVRRENRPSLEVKDEYDLQDLAFAMLKLFVDDVRKEESMPSFAGAVRPRVDVFLAEHRAFVEFKMTRTGLKDKQLTEELVQDCALYAKHPGCDLLYIVVYDPQRLLMNPAGIVNELNGPSKTGGGRNIYVKVQILR
jgi:hypothetical protein